MTKVALLTDTHWGIRSDSEYFLNNIKEFLDKIFFPYIDKHKIKRIIHLGDIVDRQKYINFSTAKRLREDFLEPIVARGLEMDVILGNHDFYYKQVTGVSALKELLREYPGIKTYYTTTESKIGTLPVLFVPWLCNENRAESINIIKETKAQVAFGHLELSGFEMHKGVFNDGGDDPRIFQRFDVVCSGHFHHKSSYSNINYLGTPCQFTWSDHGDARGFHVFDSKTRGLTFVPNPHSAFEKIYYNDVGSDPQSFLESFDFEKLNNKYVKVIVQSKTNIPLFDIFSSKIEEQNPVDIQVVDDHLNLDLVSDTTIETEAKDTLTIFREFIKQANTVVSSEKLDNLIVSLYNEALATEG